MSSYIDSLDNAYRRWLDSSASQIPEVSAAEATGLGEAERTSIDYAIASYLLDQLRQTNTARLAPATRIGGLCRLLAGSSGYAANWCANLGVAAQLVHLGVQRSAFHEKSGLGDSQLILGLAAIIKREILSPFPERGDTHHFATRCFQICRNFELALQASGASNQNAYVAAIWSMEKNSSGLYETSLFATFKRLILEEMSVDFSPALPSKGVAIKRRSAQIIPFSALMKKHREARV